MLTVLKWNQDCCVSGILFSPFIQIIIKGFRLQVILLHYRLIAKVQKLTATYGISPRVEMTNHHDEVRKNEIPTFVGMKRKQRTMSDFSG